VIAVAGEPPVCLVQRVRLLGGQFADEVHQGGGPVAAGRQGLAHLARAVLLGLRLNLYIAVAGTLAGLAWFIATQRRRPEPEATPEPAATHTGGNPG
jgi:hypothetical protein